MAGKASLQARSIEDFELSDDATRPDFELGGRFTELCKELTRMSLLGIAGYGFLLKEIVFKESGSATSAYLQSMKSHYLLMLSGLVCLGISAAASLYSSQMSTHCLKLQVDIVRYVKRRKNEGWTSEERTLNDEELARKRAYQQTVIGVGRASLRVAVGFLILGVSATVASFVVVLTVLHHS